MTAPASEGHGRDCRSVADEPYVPMGPCLRCPAHGAHSIDPGPAALRGQSIQLLQQHGSLPAVEDGVCVWAQPGEHGEVRSVDVHKRLVPRHTGGMRQGAPGLVPNLQVDHRNTLPPNHPTPSLT